MKIPRVFKFALVGGVGTLVQYLVLTAGVELFAVNPVVSSCVGYGLGFLVNYLLNFYFTFNLKAGHRAALIRYFSLSLFGFFLNLALVYLAINIVAMHYIPGQILATAVVFLSNYVLSSRWAFKAIG